VKKEFAALVFLLLLLVACRQQTATQPQPLPAQLSQSAQTVPSQPEGALKEFSINAKKWVFDPATIEVNRGDRVRLRITSSDVTHGIGIAEYGVNVELPANQEVVVDFTADRAGEFPFFCTVFCGKGHSDMRGLLIVR